MLPKSRIQSEERNDSGVDAPRLSIDDRSGSEAEEKMICVAPLLWFRLGVSLWGEHFSWLRTEIELYEKLGEALYRASRLQARTTPATASVP